MSVRCRHYSASSTLSLMWGNSGAEMTCVVRVSGWLDSTALNIAKMTQHLDDVAKDHRDWTVAIQQAKTNCLLPNLPAQGYHLNCPAYDVTHCILTSFIKNIPPSLWSSSPNCAYARQYAASCPVCPSECFARAIPVGSCNACYALQRSS